MRASARHSAPAGTAWRAHIARLVATAVVILAGVAPNAAADGFGVLAFDGQVTADALGTPYTQAAGHPYEAWTAIEFNTITHPAYGPLWPAEPAKNIFVDLPPGLVGNPNIGTRCALEQLAPSEQGQGGNPRCPTSSQVGVVWLRYNAGDASVSGAPVYNMVTPPNVPARFGFNVVGTIVTLDAELRSGSDYGLSVNVRNISEGIAMTGNRLIFWGVPADPVHDPERWCPGTGGPGCSTDAARKPFLTNPTRCTPPGVGFETRLRTDSWFTPGVFREASFVTHLPPAYPDPKETWGPVQGTTDCAAVPFDASLQARPSPPAKKGGPSGWEFDLRVPQSDDPDQIAQGHLRKAVVTLPEGARVSPSAADGLGACAPSDIRLNDTSDPSCPDSSKVGALRIETPLLERPMLGDVYLAKPNDNPFNSLITIYLVAKGPGLIVKLAGRVDRNDRNGQLIATFDEQPQLPFDLLHLEFFGGDRASLTNPPECGRYSTSAELTSWSGKTVTSTSDFVVSRNGDGAPCPPRGFTPDFIAGSLNPVGGISSPFSLTFSRDDDDQELGGGSFTLPKGLLARAADVPLCADARAAAGTCGPESLIGSLTTAAGPGPRPFHLPGRVYFGGPYKGAPFSLSFVVPAVAGPFDLGTVVVRAAIHVDRTTAELSVISDPLPTILQGIPLQIRMVNVKVDRSRFILNPTNCAPSQVGGTLQSVIGTVARVASRYQVGNCATLPYRPRLAIKIGDRRHRRAESTAPLTATLTMPSGLQANNKSVAVTLPANVNSRLAALRGACSVEAARARTCGRDAIVGTAVAVTPLLRDPLRGPVYIVRTRGNRLPDLWVALRGQIEFDLIGRVKIVGSRLQLRTTFAEVPDVPVSMFRLNFIPGRNSAIGLVRGICSAEVRRGMVAGLLMHGQNGRTVARDQKMSIGGCGRASSGRRASGRRASGRRGSRRSSRRSTAKKSGRTG